MRYAKKMKVVPFEKGGTSIEDPEKSYQQKLNNEISSILSNPELDKEKKFKLYMQALVKFKGKYNPELFENANTNLGKKIEEALSKKSPQLNQMKNNKDEVKKEIKNEIKQPSVDLKINKNVQAKVGNVTTQPNISKYFKKTIKELNNSNQNTQVQVQNVNTGQNTATEQLTNNLVNKENILTDDDDDNQNSKVDEDADDEDDDINLYLSANATNATKLDATKFKSNDVMTEKQIKSQLLNEIDWETTDVTDESKNVAKKKRKKKISGDLITRKRSARNDFKNLVDINTTEMVKADDFLNELFNKEKEVIAKEKGEFKNTKKNTLNLKIDILNRMLDENKYANIDDRTKKYYFSKRTDLIKQRGSGINWLSKKYIS